MSFVIANPEALAAAASKLEGIGAALTAQNASAAMPTTSVAPAAADEVSALQATQFSAYGTLYQQLSSQATAIHEMFVKTLSGSANTYGDTEAANAAASTPTTASSLSDLIALLTGNASGPYGLLPAALSNSSIAAAMQASNFGSAASDLLQLGSSGFLAPGALVPSEGAAADGAAPVVVNVAGSAAPAGAGAVLASAGQASSLGAMSVPTAWADATAATGTAPATLTGAGWTAAAPHSAPVTAMPAGMPGAAAAGRGGLGFGTPRYGVKPVVAPRPAVV